ncbi:MAG: alcohol dehydrogenase catalytic domain-containing protein [Fimbriimonas sp.]
MRVARYIGGGEVAIVEEPTPSCPPGGLLIQTEACGLCSGELMGWYMDRKIPHVLGHEVAGRVIESKDRRFPVGARVFPHHHAPCLKCEQCKAGHHVHCEQWKRTKLLPGGMAEFFAVPAENLNDTLIVDDLKPADAALIEPLACVVKSLRAGSARERSRSAVIGLGVMGLMHMLLLPEAIGYDVNDERVQWALTQGLDARTPDAFEEADTIFVCPGSQPAFEFALQMTNPGATIVMFAPLPPGEPLRIPSEAYFKDLRITHSYSCGPDDTREAADIIRGLGMWAEQVVSHFIGIDELPQAYQAMKRGEILKPMVLFDTNGILS